MYLKEVLMALDKDNRLKATMLLLVQNMVNKQISEKLGIILRDLNSLVKESGLSEIEEIQLQTDFLEMITKGCDGFHKKMTDRIPTKNQTPSE
jgi:DNA-binding transcriptional regulator LsrR (DeoR family)